MFARPCSPLVVAGSAATKQSLLASRPSRHSPSANSRHCEAGQRQTLGGTRPPVLPGRGNLPLPWSCLRWPDKAKPPSTHHPLPPGGKRRSPRRISNRDAPRDDGYCWIGFMGDLVATVIQIGRRASEPETRQFPTAPFAAKSGRSPGPTCAPPWGSAPPEQNRGAHESAGCPR